PSVLNPLKPKNIPKKLKITGTTEGINGKENNTTKSAVIRKTKEVAVSLKTLISKRLFIIWI
ncbi:MAG: hypothetical protein KAS07_01125, partial [Candidatus Pacebacteria bacterium]|nr:hypothetical protein [Candidatus Paceibacterota bacterium]